MELYKKHRPKNLKRIVGQETAVNILSSMIDNNKVPHSILFTGPSGCGKTTIGRILRKELNCSNLDFQEINCADFRGIDTIRDIRQRMNQAPMDGDCKIWLIDECHMLSTQAQNAFLKILEDTPKHVYFFLATTIPQKLLKTIKTRCTEIQLKEIKSKPLYTLIQYTAKKEKFPITEEVIEEIIDHSEGSARKALVLLNQILDIKGEEEQIESIISSDSKANAIEIARALIQPRTKWKDMSKILREVDEDAESLRYMILAYMTSILIKGGKLAPRAYVVIDTFRDNFYDSKKAGLVAACYEVITGTD